jgi:hypothetical protein
MNDNVWLALVAIETPVLPSAELLAAALHNEWSDPRPLKQSSRTERVLTISLGEATVAVTLVERPIRWEDIEGPCSCAWYWPDAAEAMRGHQAHLLITLVDEGRDPLDKAILLTRLASAVSEVSPAVGIYWGPGRLVHDPEPFREQLAGMARESLPLYLWIDFRVEPQTDGSLRLFTTGIEAFGRPELEVDRFQGDAAELVTLVFNVAHYVLEKGKSLNDGDTVGVGGIARDVTASERASFVDPDKQIVLLEIGPNA